MYYNLVLRFDKLHCSFILCICISQIRLNEFVRHQLCLKMLSKHLSLFHDDIVNKVCDIFISLFSFYFIFGCILFYHLVALLDS